MPPSGILIIPGVRAEITFYKGLLDKLGLEFDVLKMGKYKGAAEPLHPQGHEPSRCAKAMNRSWTTIYQDMLGVDRRQPPPERLPGQDVRRSRPVLGRRREEGRADRRGSLLRPTRRRDQEEAQRREDRNRHRLQEEQDRRRFLRLVRHDQVDRDSDGRKAVGRGRQEAENRRGLRRRPDRRGQEQQRTVRLLRVGIDLDDRRAAQGRRRSEGGGHRACASTALEDRPRPAT